jgi:hypothetical protein
MEKQQKALLLTCLGLFSCLSFMALVSFMLEYTSVDKIDWDFKTKTAGDYTVELEID